METKQLKIKTNDSKVVEFMFDSPKQGTNNYGNWNLYGLKCDGEDVSLFATDNLDGQNTVWEMIGKDEIGNVIIEQIDYRHSDGRFTVATYGRGIFQTTINSVDDVLSTNDLIRTELNIYPNPASEKINVEFSSITSEKVKYTIYNEVGRVVKSNTENINIGVNNFVINVGSLNSGLYFVSLELKDGSVTKQFIKK